MSFLLKKKFFIIILIVCLGLMNLAYILLRQYTSANPEHISLTNVKLHSNESIRIAHTEKPEKGLLIFLIDSNNVKVNEEYAKKFAALSYYVAIVDSKTLLNSAAKQASQCLNIAEKLTAMAAQLQTNLKLDAVALPILVGIENGASVAYAALAQANGQKFHAAVGINFSTKLESHPTLCEEEKFTESVQGKPQVLTVVNRLPTSYYVFQDEHSPNIANKEFTTKVGNLKLTQEENKEQAISEASQILQWLDPRLSDQISSDASDSDLPIIEVPVADTPAEGKPSNNSQTLAVIITGDGGWAEIDKNIARILAERGISTVALDALSYFWKERTPEETTQDVETIITEYLAKWNKQKVILIGYSFGADVLPFVANNLTADTKKQLALVALLGMGKTAAFEFRLSSWMNADTDASRLPLLPEVEKMKWANSICIYGVDDPAANCLAITALGVKSISMTGDHHFDEKYEELVQHIIENIKPEL